MNYYLSLTILCLLFFIITAAISIIYYILILKVQITTYHSTDYELRSILPGTEIIYRPKVSATRAYTVKANYELIWKYLIQMGSTQAGWYCFDKYFYNNKPSKETLSPQGTPLYINKLYHLKTDRSFGIPLISFKKNEHLLFGGYMNLDTKKGIDLNKVKRPLNYFALSWVFSLDPMSADETRIVTRFQADWAGRLANTKFYLLEPLQFFFEKGIIDGIAKRVEHNPKTK